MPQYTCKQCFWTVENPKCPGCGQFLTDDIDVVEGLMSPMEWDGRAPEWFTAFGHWGDAMVCCGHMKRILELAGQERARVLYVGPDLSIVDWLREQSFVEDALGVEVSNATCYPQFWQASVRQEAQPADWLKFLAPLKEGLPKWYEVTQTHVNHKWFHFVPAQLWSGGRLPAEAVGWAEARASSLRREHNGTLLIHVHPISTWSEARENHWPCWKSALERLLLTTPHAFVVTGQERLEGMKNNPRLVDMTGRVPSNCHVLALSEACDAVLSTANNIALWGAIQGQESLVVGNKATKFISSYYTRFLMRGPRTKYLSVETDFEEFLTAAQEWIRRVECPN